MEESVYDTLDSISEKERVDSSDLELLTQFANNCDEEIRSYVAELLGRFNSDLAEQILLKLCDDVDELVRTSACDSLSEFKSIESYKCLFKCMTSDQSALVKTYAILAIVDIMEHIDVDVNELKEALEQVSNSKEVKLRTAAYKGLYMLGDDEKLAMMLELLNANNYQDRCAILNMLEDIVTEVNKKCILEKLCEIKEVEDSKAVNSIIERILLKINKL